MFHKIPSEVPNTFLNASKIVCDLPKFCLELPKFGPGFSARVLPKFPIFPTPGVVGEGGVELDWKKQMTANSVPVS